MAPPTVTPAALGMTVEELRRAVSLGSYKDGVVRGVIDYDGRHWGVFRWHVHSKRRQDFTLFELHPIDNPPLLFEPRTWTECVKCGSRVDPNDLTGLVVSRAGVRWVVDQAGVIRVRWEER